MTYPSRIVCLTEETTETLVLARPGDRIVGVSGYTVRPPEARKKPKVSAFINARFDKIQALEPDLVLAFLGSAGGPGRRTRAARHRGGHVQSADRRRNPPDDLHARRTGRLSGRGRSACRSARGGSGSHPRGWHAFPGALARLFEEWDDPLISGIRWVEELVEIAGGAPVFPELAHASLAKDRIVDPAAVIPRDPQVIFASWCGKKMNKARIAGRPGWNAIGAVRDDRIFEIKSTYILQPGPASLTDGVRRIHEILANLRSEL
jgi:iron complex transport system substrate-binding protein